MGWQLVPPWSRIWISLIVIGLSGCDRESLSMEQWSEIGTREPPVTTFKGEVVMTPVAPGRGQIVQPGDLVKIEISGPKAVTAWLWTGREPESRDYANVYAWGDLGSARIRKALVGRSLGERFMLTLEKGAEGGAEPIPLNGFGARAEYTLRDNGTLAKPRRWSEVTPLESSAVGESGKAEITITQICQGRLFRRTAVMRQRGTVVNMFEMSYGSVREGTLRWSALEGTCPSPEGKVRFEVGPLYYYRGRQDLTLYNWSDSYRRLRPPDRFPDEYDVRVPPSTR